MIKQINVKIAIAFFASTFSLAGYAQQTNIAQIEVTATVESGCIISASPLAFEKYNPLNDADATKNTSITLTCVKNTPVKSITLSGNDTATNTRNMKNKEGTETLSYQVYKPKSITGSIDIASTPCDSNATEIWDNAGYLNPGAPADASARVYNLCGVIKAKQNVGAGVYADTLTATVNY